MFSCSAALLLQRCEVLCMLIMTYYRADNIYSQHPLGIPDLEYIYHRSKSPATSTGHLLNDMIPPAPLRDRN